MIDTKRQIELRWLEFEPKIITPGHSVGKKPVLQYRFSGYQGELSYIPPSEWQDVPKVNVPADEWEI